MLELTEVGDSSRAAGRGVLLTGVTGFLGKVVLDELLRRRGELGIERVVVTVRAPDDEAARGRFRREVAESPALDAHSDGWTEDIRVVCSDLSKPLAGIAPDVRSELVGQITHVVHCAASVEFALPIQEALAANVTAALHTLELARDCDVEAMVSVSTAYSTPHSGSGLHPVDEELASLPWDADDLYDAILEGAVDEASLLKESGHPNTYTLTKCLAEHLLTRRAGGIPLTLLRPSIISASRRTPEPGWIDSTAAFAGVVMLLGSGHLRALYGEPSALVDLVPCDDVARRVVDCVFDPPRMGDGVAIRHATAGPMHSPSIDLCRDRIVGFFEENPVSGGPRLGYVGSNRARFWVEDALRHRLPTALASSWHRARGQDGAVRATRRMADRRDSLLSEFPYFTHSSFDFRSSLPLESDFDPADYVDTICDGVHRNLLAPRRRRRPCAKREAVASAQLPRG
ncbi:MAG: SDR family oxidoreductase [Deltaproteobacteria bacterium]|nr:SDR family oxidoreductase [Deltaproteobacteria bacterium]